MFTERKRRLTICAAAILANVLLSVLARLLSLPLWLDTVGTVYAAILLGFPYGLTVGLVNNAFWTIVTGGTNSFAFYVVSAALAFAADRAIRKEETLTVPAVLKLFFILLAVGVVLASLLTLVTNGGIPTDVWGARLYDAFINEGVSKALACISATSIVKTLDTIVTVILVLIAVKVTPRKYRNDEFVIK